MEVKETLAKVYQKLNEHFYFFHYKNSIIGFSFSESDDALNLSDSIQFYTVQKSKNKAIENRGHEFYLLGEKVNLSELFKRDFKRVGFSQKTETIGWDGDHQCIDFHTCGEDFSHIYEDSGIKKKDVSYKKISLIMLEAMVKFKLAVRNGFWGGNDESKGVEKEKMKEKIKDQLAKRYKELLKNRDKMSLKSGDGEGTLRDHSSSSEETDSQGD